MPIEKDMIVETANGKKVLKSDPNLENYKRKPQKYLSLENNNSVEVAKSKLEVIEPHQNESSINPKLFWKPIENQSGAELKPFDFSVVEDEIQLMSMLELKIK